MPPEDLDHTLRQIATSYKDLHAQLQRFISDDPAIVALKQQAREALETGQFARAEELLNDASAKDLEAARYLQEVAMTRLRSAAASQAANGDLQWTQLAYAEAAAYYRQAAALVEAIPTARPELAQYLNASGLAFYKAGNYPAAEVPFTQALAIREEVLGPDHPAVAQSFSHLALLYFTNRVTADTGGEFSWSTLVNAYAASAAKAERRVVARGVPSNHAATRTRLSAVAVRTCWRWVLPWPM